MIRLVGIQCDGVWFVSERFQFDWLHWAVRRRINEYCENNVRRLLFHDDLATRVNRHFVHVVMEGHGDVVA